MVFAKRLGGRCCLGVAVVAAALVLMGTVTPYPAAAGPPGQALTATPAPGSMTAVVIVERAIVFPSPDRRAEPLTYVYERERVQVLEISPDGAFLLTVVDGQLGWILTAQVALESQAPSQEQPATLIPTDVPTPTPVRATPTPLLLVTATVAPTRTTGETPVPDATRAAGDGEPDSGELPAVVPGTPPPLTITLPEEWKALDLVVPFESLSGTPIDLPLTIYFGPLPDGANGYIYLYWGFPNIATLDGDYNLWADGVQILRGSLIGESCTLGLYEQKQFSIGGLEAVGASYQTSDCSDETDTAGWFGVVRVYDGAFAFYTAVEPLHAIVDQRANLQAILDSIEFLPPEDE